MRSEFALRALSPPGYHRANFMNESRKTSLTFGLFFAGTFVFSIPALFFYDPIFKNADYIRGGGFDPIISVGAIFEIFLAICNTATAIVIFPVTKRTSESGALAYVAVRIIESLIILTGVMSLMSIVTLRATATASQDPTVLVMMGKSLLAFHDWSFLLGPQFCAGLGNGLVLGLLMLRSGLLPRPMALLGVIGGPLAFLGGVLVLFGILQPMSPGLFALTALEIIWEVSLTVYTLALGFKTIPSGQVA
ncbi:MAG TPA: DUF4386 domain-containing protein [Leptospiraceae bacterium]|nr:DUF4386 domain-containing protein [Leptospirales bacterium]HMU85203.1 DUF4386 domain-containing protein [Leptospiraceae bacterium]HMY44057.1 DUF4386 domain-containing protein [Leptospiraceae bacterium]HNE23219.1 DUF4386 domain-containing protein [Leptospiraceae bacterium]HNL01804.1 DUF4386 domain-containing protein [Leptospiraceae bacterium]